jgi:hypothetical protein
VALVEMPSARAHHQDGRIGPERINLPGRRIAMLEAAAPAVAQVQLALDQIAPGRRGCVLEIRHEHARAGIEGVDDHLAVGRTGDLDPAIAQVRRDFADLPVAVPYVPRLGEEIGQRASVERPLALDPRCQQRLSPAVETAVELGDEAERVGRQNFAGAGDPRRRRHCRRISQHGIIHCMASEAML